MKLPTIAAGLIPATLLTVTSNAPAQALIDFNDTSAWNGGTGFTYSAGDPAPEPFDHTTALPYVAQSGTFGGVGVDLTYEHSNGFSQGVVVNGYEISSSGTESNMPELNAYASGSGGLIRLASDIAGDAFGNGDGLTTTTITFDTPVFVSGFLIGTIDSRNRWLPDGSRLMIRDRVQVRAFDAGGNLVDPSAQDLNPLGVTAGPAVATDLGTLGWEFTPGADPPAPPDPGQGPNFTQNLSIHAAALDWVSSGVTRIEVTTSGEREDLLGGGTENPDITGGHSFGLTGFRITPVPEPSGALLLSVAGCLALVWRRRRGH